MCCLLVILNEIGVILDYRIFGILLGSEMYRFKSGGDTTGNGLDLTSNIEEITTYSSYNRTQWLCTTTATNELNKKMENDGLDDAMKEKSDDDTGIVSKYHWKLSFIK